MQMAVHPILPCFYCTALPASLIHCLCSPQINTQHSSFFYPRPHSKISPRPQLMLSLSTWLSQGFSLLSFKQHLSDEIFSNSFHLPQNSLPKACTLSHTRLSKYWTYGPLRCFGCCVCIINAFVLVLGSLRSGVEQMSGDLIGNMVAIYGGVWVGSEGSHLSMLLLRTLAFASKRNIFMLPGAESLLGKGNDSVPESMHCGISVEGNTRLVTVVVFRGKNENVETRAGERPISFHSFGICPMYMYWLYKNINKFFISILYKTTLFGSQAKPLPSYKCM